MADPLPEGKRARGLRFALWLLVALAAVVLTILLLVRGGEQGAARETTQSTSMGGPFEMVTPDGKPFTDKDLGGKPFAIFFGFTRCPDVCPTTLSRLANLREQLGEDGDKFAIVFVSVDREKESPADIGNYIDLFDTPIIGLTGSQAQIDEIVKAYRVFYRKVPLEGGDYTIDHTASVFLMDRAGQLQSIIDHKESQEMALSKLRRLVG